MKGVKNGASSAQKQAKRLFLVFNGLALAASPRRLPSHGNGYVIEKPRSNQRAKFESLERVKGIEPSRPAWKAGTLPLSYTRLKFFVRKILGKTILKTSR